VSAESGPFDLDLRGTPCPLNFIRTRLALETLPAGAQLRVSLDRGEPELMVSEGLRAEGHQVEIRPIHPDPPETGICLLIRRGGD
jgi:TusA-related sulfurtransferase